MNILKKCLNNPFIKLSKQKYVFCMYKYNFNTSNRNIQIEKNIEELEEVKNLSEFKLGLNSLNEGKFELAETHFKESLKILKNINRTDTLAYMYILKKYSQCLFYLKKFEECEKSMQVSIELSKTIFKNNGELTFPFYRNLIAFYTYTNIAKASTYVEEIIENLFDKEKSEVLNHSKKYFLFAGGAIKLLNNEYKQARKYMSETMSISDLSAEYQAFNLHNLALLNLEMTRDYEIVEGQELKNTWKREFDFSGDVKILEKESLVLYKQSIYKLEIDFLSRDDKNLKLFLLSPSEIPENFSNEEEEILYENFKNSKSGLTITNLAEMFFEKGSEKEKSTAFWLKAGIKHYEKYEKENIARHLIIFALFYSQLGQTMYAEGLYRKSIELLKNNTMNNMNYNLAFATNMYGRLLLRADKRQAEGIGKNIFLLLEMLKKSELLIESLPFWYHRMCKTRYLDFDFD